MAFAIPRLSKKATKTRKATSKITAMNKRMMMCVERVDAPMFFISANDLRCGAGREWILLAVQRVRLKKLMKPTKEAKEAKKMCVKSAFISLLLLLDTEPY